MGVEDDDAIMTGSDRVLYVGSAASEATLKDALAGARVRLESASDLEDALARAGEGAVDGVIAGPAEDEIGAGSGGPLAAFRASGIGSARSRSW